MAVKITWDNLIRWLYGLLKVMIAGGAGSVVSAFGATIIDNKDFAIGSLNFREMIYVTFLLHLAINGFMYLQKAPLPELTEEDTGVSQPNPTKE